MDSESPIAVNGSWPANHRAALIVFIHVDAPDLDRPDEPLGAGLDYTATGLQRLLRTLADLDVPATLAWSPRALSSFPQLARNAQDQGHELALSKAAPRPDSHDESVLSRISDKAPSGVVESLPIPGLPTETLGTIASQFSWLVTGVSGDVPISTIRDGGQGPTIIPVSPYWIDIAWLAPEHPLPPSSLLEAWSLALGEVRSEGGLMTIVLHPHVSGRPGFAAQVQRFLDEVIESGDVWIASAAQVAEWWRQQEQAGQ